MGQLDVGEPALAEREEALAVAAGELGCAPAGSAGRVGADDCLGLRGAVVLGPGDVATGDDRREHEGGRHVPKGAQAANLARFRRWFVVSRAAQDEQQGDHDHRHAEVDRDELILEALLDGEPAERRLKEDEHADGDRTADEQTGASATGAMRATPSGRSGR